MSEDFSEMQPDTWRSLLTTTLSAVLLWAIFAINEAFAITLGDLQIVSGVRLGTAILLCSSFWVIVGLNGALDTLVSQAYGSGDLKQCGTYLNRGRVISAIAFVPLAIALCFSE